jgi:hypothetical protein
MLVEAESLDMHAHAMPIYTLLFVLMKKIYASSDSVFDPPFEKYL